MPTNPRLVRIELFSKRTLGCVIAEALPSLYECDRLVPALVEVLQSPFQRSEAVGRLQGFRCLRLVAAIWNRRQNELINGLDVFASGSGGCLHYLLLHHPEKHIFGGGDMLATSATDQRLGTGLKFNCAADIPLGGL